MAARLINKNYAELYKALEIDKKKGVVMEGGSRSGKTWSAVDFIIYLCTHKDKPTINIIKETFAGFKTTLYEDFARRLDQIGAAHTFRTVQNIATYTLFGGKLNFMGADQPAKFHGAACDYFYINEALDVQKDVFDQVEMRCRVGWFIDYNPKWTDHWIFDKVIPRPDVSFVHSTLLDNPFIGKAERLKILSTAPTQDNITAGTADKYLWDVYGLGKRAAHEGLVFPAVTWIDSFPEDIEKVFYGLDFGYTNDPTALVKIGVNGRNLYMQSMLYKPYNNGLELAEAMEPLLPRKANCWCDSADPAMIGDLRKFGFLTIGAKKFDGCINYRNDLMRRYKIHLIKDANFRKEQENYVYKSVNGILLNTPIDGYDHLWSAAGYACQHELR